MAELRRARDMSQDELAARLDVSRTIVSAWENGHRRPPADRVAELAEVLRDDGRLARLWAAPDSAVAGPLFEPALSVTALRKDAVDALTLYLSTDDAADSQPGYGWRHDLDDTTQKEHKRRFGHLDAQQLRTLIDLLAAIRAKE